MLQDFQTWFNVCIKKCIRIFYFLFFSPFHILLIAKICLNQPLHDHHFGYITKKLKEKRLIKPLVGAFSSLVFLQFCDIEMANFPSKIQNQTNL
jgi:hypothetical protein